MSTYCIYQCGGCDAEAKSRALSRRFESVSGRSYGFGRWIYDTPESVAPAGWVVFDPYTGCTYCPSCWREIEGAAP